jgi:hypothetical protein
VISEEAGQEPGGKPQDLLDVLNLEALDAPESQH